MNVEDVATTTTTTKPPLAVDKDDDEKHRRLVQYSVCSCWNTRLVDLGHAKTAWKEGVRLAMAVEEAPPCEDAPLPYQHLFETADDDDDVCDCNLCKLRGQYHEAFRQFQKKRDELQVEMTKNKNFIIPEPQQAETNNTIIPPEQPTNDTTIEDDIRIAHGDLLKDMKEEAAQCFIQRMKVCEQQLRKHKKEIQRLDESTRKQEKELQRLDESRRKQETLRLLDSLGWEVIQVVGSMQLEALQILAPHKSTAFWIWFCTKIGRRQEPDFPEDLAPIQFDVHFNTLHPRVVMEQTTTTSSAVTQDLKEFYHGLLKTMASIAITNKIQGTQRSILDWSNQQTSDAPNEKEKGAIQATVTEGYQALFYAVLYKLMSIRKPDRTSKEPVSRDPPPSFDSNETSARLKERLVKQRVHERLREMLSSSSSSCYAAIKFKPLQGTDTNLTYLHELGIQQVVGTLAEQIQHYFDLGGVGCNHKCRGMILTLVSVEIVEMELEDVGTEHVNVTLRRTLPYFLYDRETTKHLLKGMQVPNFLFDTKNPWHGLGMVEAVLNNTSDDKVLPFSNMVVQYKDREEALERCVVRHLGTGHYAVGYQLDDTTIIKVATCPSFVPRLELEMHNLRLLNRECSCPVIPTLSSTDLGIVRFQRGCEKSQLAALAISGIVGISASKFQTFNTTQLTQVFSQVKSALMHAHKNAGICHLDVRPSSIIVKQVDSLSLQVQLSDWTYCVLLTDKSSYPQGFCGCPPFVHDDIHLLKSKLEYWEPKPKHDFASLVLTMVALIAETNNLLPDFVLYGVTKRMLDERRQLACRVIDGSDLDQALKLELRRYLCEAEPEMFAASPLDQGQATCCCTASIQESQTAQIKMENTGEHSQDKAASRKRKPLAQDVSSEEQNERVGN